MTLTFSADDLCIVFLCAQEGDEKGPMPLLLRANGKGPLSNFKQCKIMKSNRFLLLFSLLIAANAVAYFSSCRQDEVATLAPKPTSDMPVGERACANGFCEYQIISDVSNTVELCGDLAVFTGTCTGCGTIGIDRSIMMTVPTSAPGTVCVASGGSICITNPSTSPQTMNITVTAGTGGSQNVTLAPGQRACFHSNANCDATVPGCY